MKSVLHTISDPTTIPTQGGELSDSSNLLDGNENDYGNELQNEDSVNLVPGSVTENRYHIRLGDHSRIFLVPHRSGGGVATVPCTYMLESLR